MSKARTQGNRSQRDVSQSSIENHQSPLGRPKGAGNIARPVVVAVPARCPSCQGTNYKRTPGRPPVVHEISGISKLTGDPYNFVAWYDVICACGQHFRVREEFADDPREIPW